MKGIIFLVGSEFDFNNSYTINFWCPKTNSQSPRYTVIIVDSAKEMLRSYAGKYGVFIVPQGIYCLKFANL